MVATANAVATSPRSTEKKMISIACSGPNSTAKIMTNAAISNHSALMVFGVLACMLLLSVKRKKFNRLLWFPIILLIVHPAWMISATKGDCGIQKREASELFTFLALAVLSWQILSYIYLEELKPEEKRARGPYVWLIFGFSAIINLISSAISVVPNSPADTFNSILYPTSALLSLLSLIAAIYLWVVKRKSKRAVEIGTESTNHNQPTK